MLTVPDVLDDLEGRVRTALQDPAGIWVAIGNAHPADIADVLDRLRTVERRAVVAELEPRLAAQVLHEASTEVRKELLDGMTLADAARLLALLPMDQRVHVLEAAPPDRRTALLGALDAVDAQGAAEARLLLAYAPRSAGRLMTEQFPTVDEHMSAAEALAHVRQIHADCETITDLYVLTPGRELEAVVSLRELVTAEPSSRVADLVHRDVVSVLPETDREDAARLVSRYDFLALPVVDADGVMLGVITVDDVIDVLVGEGAQDVLRLGGVEPASINQPYFSVPFLQVVRKRFGWLLLLFVAETLTGTVLRAFESELAQVVALSFFIPLLIGTGGNTGAQTVSTLIRGLALHEIRLRDTLRVVRRELVSGLVLGLLLGTVGFGRALLWGSSVDLSLVVGLSLLAICTWANTIGALIPLVAVRFKIDPALVSAPLITTLVDATGLAIYLFIAGAILGL